MIYKEKLLSDAAVKHVLNFYEFCKFRDGSHTGPKSKDIKYNLELFDEDHSLALNKMFLDEIKKNAILKNCFFPKKFSLPMFLKYDENMHYSFHNDHYEQSGVKTHYSVTVFLSDPSEYEGGELIIKMGNQEMVYKEKPGMSIIYPTGLWHIVNNVTSGCRKVAVFWFQSIIDDPTIRDCCYDLSRIIYNSNENPEEYNISIKQCLAIDNIKYKLMRVYGNFN